MIDRVPALAQPLDQIGGGLPIVFDDEELHRGAPRCPFGAGRASGLFGFAALVSAANAGGRTGTIVSASVLDYSTFVMIDGCGRVGGRVGFKWSCNPTEASRSAS